MLRRGIQGEVLLRILVGADGRPEKIEIEKSSGHREFDRSAMQAAKNWKFNPGVRDGVAYAGWALVPVRFTLAD
jgi:protein TonB